MLRQIVELMPAYLVSKLARETGAEAHARTFTLAWLPGLAHPLMGQPA